MSGSRWASTPQGSSDKNKNLDGAGKEAHLAQVAGQSSVGQEKDDRPSGEPQDDQGRASGEGSPHVRPAPVPANGEKKGEKTKDKPKALGQAVVSKGRKSCAVGLNACISTGSTQPD